MRCGPTPTLPPGCECIPPGNADGQILLWDGTSWVAGSEGTDVGQVLVWDGAAWVPGVAAARTIPFQYAAITMAAAPSTSFLYPGNGATASILLTVAGSFVAPFDGNLNTFWLNHRNPSLAVNITYELQIEGVVQAAATMVLSSGAAGPTSVVANVPITAGQRFNVTAILPVGAPTSARPVWQCLLTE